MAAGRRWILFGLALASLVVMTYAGVLFAFSVPVTDEMLETNRDLPDAGRALVMPIVDARSVRTHASAGDGVLLVRGESEGTFPAGATDLAMARALAYVEPMNGTYEPANLSLVDVPTSRGTSDLTIDVASLAGGATGWIVMGTGETEPRFFAKDDVLGEVARFASGTTLGLTLALGFLGFVAPLVGIILTHRPSGKRGAPTIVCRECGAPFPHNGEFCLRCGAYKAGVEA